MDNDPLEGWNEACELAPATVLKLPEEPDEDVIPIKESVYVIQVVTWNVAVMLDLGTSIPEIGPFDFRKEVIILHDMDGISYLYDVIHVELGGELGLPIVIRHLRVGEEWYVVQICVLPTDIFMDLGHKDALCGSRTMSSSLCVVQFLRFDTTIRWRSTLSAHSTLIPYVDWMEYYISLDNVLELG